MSRVTRGELFPSLSAFICEMDILEDGPGMFLRDPQKLGAGVDSGPQAGRRKVSLWLIHSSSAG